MIDGNRNNQRIGYYDNEEAAAVDYARAVFKYKGQGALDKAREQDSIIIDLSDVPPQPPIPKSKGRIKEGASKYTGVHFSKQANKWHAQIRIEEKALFIGSYENEEAAAVDYARAVFKYKRCKLNAFNFAAQPTTSAPASAPPLTASMPTRTACAKRSVRCLSESTNNRSCEDSSSTSSEDSEDDRKRKKQRTLKTKQHALNELARIVSSMETNLKALQSLSNLCSGVVAKLNEADQLASNLDQLASNLLEYEQPPKRVTCKLLCPCCNKWRNVEDWIGHSWSPFRRFGGLEKLRLHNPNLYHGIKHEAISPEIHVLQDVLQDVEESDDYLSDDKYQSYSRTLLLCSGFKIFLILYLKLVVNEDDIEEAMRLCRTNQTDDTYQSNGIDLWINLIVTFALRRKEGRRERFDVKDIGTVFSEVRNCIGGRFKGLVLGDGTRIDIRKLIWDEETNDSFGRTWNMECAKGFGKLYKTLFHEMEQLSTMCEAGLEEELKKLFCRNLTAGAMFKVMKNASENKDAFVSKKWRREIKDLKQYQEQFAGCIAKTISLHCRTLKIIKGGAQHS